MTSSDPVAHAGLAHAHGSEPSNSALVHRIMEFERILADRLATRVEVLPFGIARICPDRPQYYDASGVEVTGHVTGDELLRTTESVFADAGLRHCSIHTTVAEVASSVGPSPDRPPMVAGSLVYMAHDRRLRGGRIPGVRDCQYRNLGAGGMCVRGRSGVDADPAVIADMAAHDRRLAARIDVRFILTDDATTGCHLYQLGHIAQIENIYVLSHARSNGLGRTLRGRSA